MKRQLLLLAAVVLVLGPASGQGALPAVPDRLIAGFEEDADAALVSSEQDAPREISTAQASRGKRSLKVVLPPGAYPGVQIRVPADWRGHEALRFDLWCERASSMGIRIDDASSTSYNTRYNEDGGVLRQGWNHVQVPLDRVKQVLDLGKIRALIPFLTNVRETTTVYLDNVHLGPLLEDYDDRPLPGELGEKKEFRYSMEVETPHVKWARPLAGGPVKALLVTGVAAGREAIELAQRLDLDFDVVTIEKQWDVNRWGMGDHYGARGEKDDFRLIYRYLEQALTAEKRYDVIVLPMVHGWNMLTKRSREALLKRVGEGTGLVLVRPFVGKEGRDRRIREVSPLVEGPDDFFGGGGYVASPPEAMRTGKWEPAAPHWITHGIPLSLLPFERLRYATYKAAGEVILKAGEDPIAAVREYGKGRVVALAYRGADFTPEVSGDGKSEPPYPYAEVFHRLVIRAMLWAARRDAAPRLKVSVPNAGVVAWGSPAPEITVGVEIDGIRDAELEVEPVPVRAYEGSVRASQHVYLPKITGQGLLAVPVRLPEAFLLHGGETVVDFILRSEAGTGPAAAPERGKVVEFASVVLTVAPPATIQRVEVPAGGIAEGAEVPVSATLAGGLPAGSRVSFVLVDDLGRVLSRGGTAATSNTVSAKLACRGVVTPWVAVEARLTADGRLLDRKRTAMVPVLGRGRQPDDDFHAFMSGVGFAGHPYLRPAYLRRFRDMGVEVGSVFGGDVPNSLHVGGLGVYAYSRGPYSARLKQYQQTGDKLRFLARDPCLNDPAWREKTREHVLAAARKAVPFRPFSYYVADESSLTSYTDAVDFCFSPHCLTAFRAWLKEEYGTLERLNAQWGTRFAAWDEVVPDTSDEAKKRGNFCAWADHRTFMERTFADAFRFIRDCVREVDPEAEIKISGTQATVAHNGCDWYRLTQAIQETGPYTTGDQWELHRSFIGKGRIGGWTGYGSSGDGVRHLIWKGLLHRVSYMNIFWQYSCLNPDLTFSRSARDMAVAFKELSGGAGLLVNRLQRDNCGVAVHYSLPSVHAAWITGRQAALDATRHGLTVLLEDLGLQYDFLAAPQIEAGELSRFRCLILPHSLALSDKEVAAVGEFARKGGLVLRAGPVGEMDEHCGRRSAPALAEARALPEGIPGYERSRDSDAGREVREAARRLLRGLGPGVEVTAGGKELIHCERVLFRDGMVEVLALLRDDLGGRRVVGPDGVEYRQEAPGGAGGPEKVEVRLRRPSFVTDMRTGKALGRVDRFETEIRPAEAKLYSLLLYEVRGLKVAAEGARVRVEVDAAGSLPGCHVFHVEVTRPDGTPEPLYARNVAAKEGAATFDIPFCESDPAGAWTVSVRDAATWREATIRVAR